MLTALCETPHKKLATLGLMSAAPCIMSATTHVVFDRDHGGTGEKAIGTGWTVAPPEEEESNWGGTTLTM